MNEKQTNKKQLSRVQALVPNITQRRIKAAAALRGLTIEEWIEQAADEKLSRDGVPQIVA